MLSILQALTSIRDRPSSTIRLFASTLRGGVCACIRRKPAVMRDPIPAHQQRTLIAIVVATLCAILLVELHTPHVNGPWYGVAHYRRLPAMRVYPLMLAAAIPTLLAAPLFDRLRRRCWLLLLLAMLTVFSAKLISAMVHDPSLKLDFLSYAVMDKDATSYYVDAVALSNFPGWLAEFPSIMPHLHLHSMTKAPGSILYYLAFIKALGDSPRTALIAGITLAVISTLSIPACYLFLRELKLDESAAFLGACFLSLCPGYILFFPASDPFYPVLSCLVGLFWIRAVSRERRLLHRDGHHDRGDSRRIV